MTPPDVLLKYALKQAKQLIAVSTLDKTWHHLACACALYRKWVCLKRKRAWLWLWIAAFVALPLPG